MNEYIILQGSEYTIEWYFNSNGKSQPLKYFDNLDNDEQIEALRLFETMAKNGKIFNITKFRHEGDGIYAFKPQPHRFLCFFFAGKKIIITNAFVKKQDQLPPQEKKKAIAFQKEYERRVKSGEYYE